MVPFTPPGFQVPAFNCPHCEAYSQQVWLYFQQAFQVGKGPPQGLGDMLVSMGMVVHNDSLYSDLNVALCCQCKKYSIWYQKQMIFPNQGSVPLPNSDLPDEIRQDYEEARSIVEFSPRGAAALLRLAIQKLCKHLGGSGKDLNHDIKFLVQKGLPVQVQQALDIVRVIGNEGVRPGQTDLNDDPGIAQTLFSLVNIIAEKMITEPKQIASLYLSPPQGKRQQIQMRDSSP